MNKKLPARRFGFTFVTKNTMGVFHCFVEVFWSLVPKIHLHNMTTEKVYIKQVNSNGLYGREFNCSTEASVILNTGNTYSFDCKWTKKMTCGCYLHFVKDRKVNQRLAIYQLKWPTTSTTLFRKISSWMWK